MLKKSDVLNAIPESVKNDEYSFRIWKQKYIETVLTNNPLYFSPATNTVPNMSVTLDNFGSDVNDLYDAMRVLKDRISKIYVSLATRILTDKKTIAWEKLMDAAESLNTGVDNAIEMTYHDYDAALEFLKENEKLLVWLQGLSIEDL